MSDEPVREILILICTRCGLCNEDGTHKDPKCPVQKREGNAITNFNKTMKPDE